MAAMTCVAEGRGGTGTDEPDSPEETADNQGIHQQTCIFGVRMSVSKVHTDRLINYKKGEQERMSMRKELVVRREVKPIQK